MCRMALFSIRIETRRVGERRAASPSPAQRSATAPTQAASPAVIFPSADAGRSGTTTAVRTTTANWSHRKRGTREPVSASFASR
jgi:hypothetical protein